MKIEFPWISSVNLWRVSLQCPMSVFRVSFICSSVFWICPVGSMQSSMRCPSCIVFNKGSVNEGLFSSLNFARKLWNSIILVSSLDWVRFVYALISIDVFFLFLSIYGIYANKSVGKLKFVSKSLQKDWSLFILFFFIKLEFKGKNLDPY